MPKITLHVVSSLDGFIARRDNSVSWFESTDRFEKGVSQESQEESLKSIDCYVMGSKTYEHAVELSKNHGWVYGETPTIVASQRSLPIIKNTVEVYGGDLESLVHEKLDSYQNVWVVGGAILIQEFLKLKLADEIRLFVMPVMLGGGLRLFSDDLKYEQSLHLANVTAFDNGLVELHYEILK